jgi:fructose-1,6-bisphosphatase-3
MEETQERKYLRQLACSYPTCSAAFTEIINLKAILALPKGTEHFISDLHGEYRRFLHLINSCSGVIREKVLLLPDLSEEERSELCTLIYYPHEKLAQLHEEKDAEREWYRKNLKNLIELAKMLSSKYTRSKVRKAMPVDFSYIIDELLHAQKFEDDNRQTYHAGIIESILDTGSADEFIFSLCALIKRLAVDRLHIIGDIFDRGAHADKIMDILSPHPSLDIQWGNHDILWMGAAAGSEACMMNVVRNSVRYGNYEILENGYGIPLRKLAAFAEKTYCTEDGTNKLQKAVDVLLCKLEGQAVLRNPEFHMEDRLLFEHIHPRKKCVDISGKAYAINTRDFPTVDWKHPYDLTPEEQEQVDMLCAAFASSERLQRHVALLYKRGAMYTCCNGNLLFHGCIPMKDDGSMQDVVFERQPMHGKAYMEYAEMRARRAHQKHEQKDLDFMWYLWCGRYSPLCGKEVKTFERAYCTDSKLWEEEKDAYYVLTNEEDVCRRLLLEFGLFGKYSHIINGHMPVHMRLGESPVRGNGKLIVIDGGFCKSYQEQTGIAGYTLIFNSHGMRLKAHMPLRSEAEILDGHTDIESATIQVEQRPQRVMVRDTDDGKAIQATIEDLQRLLQAYRDGTIRECR